MRIIFFSSIGNFFKRFFDTCQDYWYVPPKPEAPKPVVKTSKRAKTVVKRKTK